MKFKMWRKCESCGGKLIITKRKKASEILDSILNCKNYNMNYIYTFIEYYKIEYKLDLYHENTKCEHCGVIISGINIESDLLKERLGRMG